jgi:hydrogenase maturation protein HypF
MVKGKLFPSDKFKFISISQWCSMKFRHIKFKITGIVQGVGFRPFVFNLAKSLGLKGYVLNDSSGVTIEIEGEEASLCLFRETLLKSPPPSADIQSIEEEISEKIENHPDFKIKNSADNGEKTVMIPPDIATCRDCIDEMENPHDRRHDYPFINCTNCGPRFTIINNTPYDRKHTSMADFIMCDYCRNQYENPEDRRFHAQPLACPACGPQLTLYDNEGNDIESSTVDIIHKVVSYLKEGKIVAIKGLGGYHLAVDALNEDAVKELRTRKNREEKPFAVMAENLETARKYCRVSDEEKALLNSSRKPIVLLEKLPESSMAPSVAPNNRYLGMMLPYTPLHHLIMRNFGNLLVMTSGNICEEPICYIDKETRNRLHHIADYFLTNNREILTRNDDSVTRVLRGKEDMIRRSRGYVPYPIILKTDAPVPILAVGGHLKNTFCLYRNNHAFVSQHMGDLENIEAIRAFEEGIEHFRELFDMEPEAVAYDMHPGYASTHYAAKLPVDRFPVQHHHAHIASVMADHDLETDSEVTGVALDGSGYGIDGKLWGFEIMRADYSDFERFMHLAYIPLPGGEQAIREPWRTAVAYLYGIYGEDIFNLHLPLLHAIDPGKIESIISMINKRINSPEISSAGRLFDAVSSITGTRQFCSFEGQAAIDLEMKADPSAAGHYKFVIKGNIPPFIIDPSETIQEIAADVIKGINTAVISGRFHNTVVEMVLSGVRMLSESTDIKQVALGGGVFQNMLLINKMLDALEVSGFEPLVHRRVPTNDGGLSLGQAIIAATRWRTQKKGR